MQTVRSQQEVVESRLTVWATKKKKNLQLPQTANADLSQWQTNQQQ